MIPLAAVPWKAIGYGLAFAAALAAVWWGVNRLHAMNEAYHALPGVQAALEAEQACGEGSECQKRQAALQAVHAAVLEQVNNGHEKELADIRSRPIPTRVIRVCREAGTGGVRVPANPGDPAGAPASGVVSGTDEFDTRPLRELARRADEVSTDYRWLRNRDRALATPPAE